MTQVLQFYVSYYQRMVISINNYRHNWKLSVAYNSVPNSTLIYNDAKSSCKLYRLVTYIIVR